MLAKNITLTVELGSDGFQLARAVADRLNYRYYDWEVTAKAAQAAGVTPETVAAAEQAPSTLQRMAERFMLAGRGDDTLLYYPPSSGTVGAAISLMTSDDYRHFIERVVLEIAREGNAVIVGHASQVTLKDEPDVLKVLIVGSIERRAARLASDEKVIPAEARTRLRHSDEERAQFFKRFYKVDWQTAALYDLTLNTDNLANDAGIDLVVEAARSLVGIPA
jgi:cytidylate kinase